MPCWLLGLIFGYLFYYKKFKPSRKLNLLLWVISLGVMLKLVTGQTVFISTEYSLHRSVLWNALARPLWSLCICFIIYSCGVGNGGKTFRVSISTIIRFCRCRQYFSVTCRVSSFKQTYLQCVPGAFYRPFVLLRQPKGGATVRYHRNCKNSKFEDTFYVLFQLFKFIGLFVLVLATSVILYLGFEAPIVSLKDQQEEKSATKNI